MRNQKSKQKKTTRSTRLDSMRFPTKAEIREATKWLKEERAEKLKQLKLERRDELAGMDLKVVLTQSVYKPTANRLLKRMMVWLFSFSFCWGGGVLFFFLGEG